ncbi:hypothetical protein [Paenibacillus silviterrae]|uniref:hypothetical protein n=1 Tax=Paenibacillus silviterrae TaxID=3242194 RepID=UPI002542B536|nr:hypothetical protein [Paenibacillus chinjuensis]
MPAKTYDPSDVSVIVDNVYITGLGEDMVEVLRMKMATSRRWEPKAMSSLLK